MVGIFLTSVVQTLAVPSLHVAGAGDGFNYRLVNCRLCTHISVSNRKPHCVEHLFVLKLFCKLKPSQLTEFGQVVTTVRAKNLRSKCPLIKNLN